MSSCRNISKTRQGAILKLVKPQELLFAFNEDSKTDAK